MPASTPRLGYRPALDGLRAAAVVAVFGRHTLIVPGGYVGVCLFFVLSGFLITTLLLEERDGRGSVSLVRFYARRALRLLPALIIMLAACRFLLVDLVPPGSALRTVDGMPYVIAYAGNWVMSLTGGGSLGMLGHTWSLSLEEQFYVAWPAVLLLVARWRGLHSTLVVALGLALAIGISRIVLALQGVGTSHLYYGARGDELFIGCTLALLLRTRPEVIRGLARLMPLGVAILVGNILVAPDMTNPYFVEGGGTVIALASAVVVAGAYEGRMGRLLTLRPCVGLGRISYAVYLWQLPIIEAVQATTGLPSLGVAAVAAPLTCGLAMLSRRYVETPCLRISQRMHRVPRPVLVPKAA